MTEKEYISLLEDTIEKQNRWVCVDAGVGWNNTHCGKCKNCVITDTQNIIRERKERLLHGSKEQ